MFLLYVYLLCQNMGHSRKRKYEYRKQKMLQAGIIFVTSKTRLDSLFSFRGYLPHSTWQEQHLPPPNT